MIVRDAQWWRERMQLLEDAHDEVRKAFESADVDGVRIWSTRVSKHARAIHRAVTAEGVIEYAREVVEGTPGRWR